jgi:hypothetical protein
MMVQRAGGKEFLLFTFKSFLTPAVTLDKRISKAVCDKDYFG